MAGFQRRDRGNPWAAGLSNALNIGAGHLQQEALRADEIGNQVKQQAATERDQMLAGLSDPNSNLTPQQRGEFENMASTLGQVAVADPRQAAELYTGIQGAMNRTRQVTQPNGQTKKGGEAYQQQVDPSQALSFLSSKVSTGNQRYTESMYKRELADTRQTGRASDNRQDRMADENREDEQAFQTETAATANANNRSNAQLEQNMARFDRLSETLTDPAASPEVKRQTRVALEQMKQENPDLEGLVIGGSVTDRNAVAGQQAAYKSPILALEQARQDLATGELANVGERQRQAVVDYQFGNDKLTDSVDLASRGASAALVGDTGALQKMKHVLQNPELYPQEYDKLVGAGYTLQSLNEDIGIAKAVRADAKGDIAYRQAERKHTLVSLASANEMETIGIAKSYAESFETKEQYQAFMAKPGNRAKFTPEVLSLLDATVTKNDAIYKNNKAAGELAMMLEMPPPTNPEMWKGNFMFAAGQAQMTPGAAEAIADGALNGWEMDGAEFDATMLRSGMELDLLDEQIETQRLDRMYMPGREARAAGESASGIAAQDASTTATNIDNTTRGDMNRAQLASVRADRVEAEAGAELARLEGLAAAGNAEAERQLLKARTNAQNAQADASKARAESLRNPQAGAAGGVDLHQVVNAQRQVIEGEVDSIIQSGMRQGCFAPPPADIGDRFALSYMPTAPGEEYGSTSCQNLSADLEGKRAELGRTGEQLTKVMLTEHAVAIGGTETRLSLAAFNIVEELNRVMQQQLEIPASPAVGSPEDDERVRLEGKRIDLAQRLQAQTGATNGEAYAILEKFRRNYGQAPAATTTP